MQSGKTSTDPGRCGGIWWLAVFATLVVPCGVAGAAGAASFFDTRPTEFWATWAAGVLLVLVVGGTRCGTSSSPGRFCCSAGWPQFCWGCRLPACFTGSGRSQPAQFLTLVMTRFDGASCSTLFAQLGTP